MRKELQFENRPIAWGIFLICTMIYCAGFGFVPNIHATNIFFICCWVSFFISVSSFYIMLLTEPKNFVELRKISKRVQQSDLGRVSVNIPTWFISLLFTAIACLVMLIFKNTADLSTTDNDYDFFIKTSPISFFFFCLRDLGIVFLVNLSSTKKNRDMTAIFYLAILYLLVPILLSIAGAKMVLPWFVPLLDENPFNAIIPIAVQAAVSLHFAWKKLHA